MLTETMLSKQTEIQKDENVCSGNSVVALTKAALRECKKNKALIFALAQTFVVKMGAMFTQGVYALYFNKIYQDNAEALAQLQMVYLYSAPLTLTMWYPIGKLMDKVSPFKMITISMIMRSIPCLLCYIWEDSIIVDPKILILFIMIGAFTQLIVCDAFFNMLLRGTAKATL